MNSASLLLAALLLNAPTAAPAQEVSLNGTWDVVRNADGQMPAADAQWTPVEVPSFLRISNGKSYAWYRRQVEVPKNFAGRHVFLCFQGVKYVSEVYLNGKQVGEHYGGWEPFEVDITGQYRTDGPNELLVRAQDCSAMIDQEIDYTKQGPGVRLVDQAPDKLMAPVGSQYSTFGIWEPVRLVARDDVYVEDVFARTSFRKKRIEVDVTLRNLDSKARKVTLTADLAEGAERGPNGGLGFTKELELPGGATVTHTFARDWPSARLWGPEDPYLYHLTSTVTDGGKTLHTESTRFGFREFWTDGPDFVLNGVPMHFLATAGHPRGQPGDELSKASAIDFFHRIREAGCVAMRLHANVWPKHWYEAADEVGMPLIMESALFCWSRSYALSNPKFWENYRNHLTAIVRDHHNHPAIVMISLENEILHCGGNRVPETIPGLADAGRLVRRLDPTRPIMYDGDGDPEGVADVINLHYPLNFDKENLWPNCAWWLEKGMVVSGWPHEFFQWDRKKPLYFGEFLHLQHYRQPDNYTTLLGDWAYEDFNQAMAECKARAWRMQIAAYRGCDVSGMCPWTLTETGDFPSKDNPRYLAVRDSYRKQVALVRNPRLRCSAGETFKQTAYVYNDTPEAADLTVSWRLDPRDDSPKNKTFHLGPAEYRRFDFEMTAPKVEKRTTKFSELVVRDASGDEVATERWWCEIFPSRPLTLTKGLRIAVLRGTNEKLVRALRANPVEVVEIDNLASIPEADVLLIGPNAISKIASSGTTPVVGDPASPRRQMALFARRGGTIIVLEQDSYVGSAFPVQLIDRGCTKAFVRSLDLLSPRSDRKTVLCGMLGGEFSRWADDDVVAWKTIRKPTSGPWRTIVDSGGPEGLVYCPLVELREGLGRYFFCQLLVGEKFDTEPAARLMLENMFNTPAEKNPPAVKLAVVAEKLPLADAVNEVGARFTDLSGKLAETDLKPFGVILVEADAAEVAESRNKLRRFAESGGVVMLHAATPHGLARLRDLFNDPITAQRSTGVPITWGLPVMHNLIGGLSNQELCWYGSREDLTWRERTPLSTAVCDYTIVAGQPDPKKLITTQAEEMEVAQGTPRKSKDGVYMWTAAALKTTVDLPKDDAYMVAVRGRGTPVGGGYPELTISIDGKRIGVLNTEGKDWGTYYLASELLDKGTHELKVAFTNDKYDPEKNEDRNVEIDWVAIGPVDVGDACPQLEPAALMAVSTRAKSDGYYLLDQIRWDRPEGNAEKASRYLSCLLNNLNCEFDSPVDVLSLTGEAFERVKGVNNYKADKGIAHIGSNGTVATTVRFAKTRKYRFAVVAEGSEAGGEFPKFDLSIDGRKLGTLTITRAGRQTLRLEADVPEGEHRLEITFTNDYYDPPADRNLRVYAVEIR